MTISKKGLDLIKSFEGCKLNAYLCPAGVATIGWGSTMYPSGGKVKMGDTISQQRADDMLKWEAENKAIGVKNLLMNTVVNQNQFDALVSFAFNCGLGNLKISTLIKKVRNNPNDPTIRDEFMKWVRARGEVLKGLQRRRKAEADLYFS